MLSVSLAQDKAEKLVEQARRAGADAADALYIGERSSGVQVRKRALEDVHRSEGEEMGLRVFLGAKSASVAWVVGYDTLYAIQDMEDDALVGVKSSARRLGNRAPLGVGLFYALALVGWGAALWMVKPDWLALVALVPAAIHLAGQAMRADPKDGEAALALFRSNRWCGLLVFLAMLVVGVSAR